MVKLHEDTRAILQPSQMPASQDGGWIVPASRRSRPLWFDGRFLAARDLERDQIVFLHRQARLGRAAGFGVVHGLLVQRVAVTGQPPDADTIVIRAGQGVTPGGEMVMLASDLTVKSPTWRRRRASTCSSGFPARRPPWRVPRTGLFVIALRPVQFTANPISSYPTSVQGSAATHDGDIVEATAVSLAPFSLTSSNADTTAQQAAAARQIFLAGDAGTLSPSLLPVAMVSIQRGALAWVDPYLVRRDSGPEFDGLRFGVSDPATQQAFLLQYDVQLLQAVAPLLQNSQPAHIAASDYFRCCRRPGAFPWVASTRPRRRSSSSPADPSPAERGSGRRASGADRGQPEPAAD